ncbi:MAG: hypothetical protein A2252_07960 [Elusimicrobia bacterium RIFOXYA2_FULL_39_19]|nr:MAG: hypothetical protein A2252_07960 [Elusimicrobia bacterium RIFOXYA2_FULL_39_19]
MKTKPKQPTNNTIDTTAKYNWLFITIIFIVTFTVYFNSLKAPFILDDYSKIEKNMDIRDLNNVWHKLIYPYDKTQNNWARNDPSRPLTYLSFAINYHFNQLNPFGYHLTSVVLHILNAILLFFLLKKLLKLIRYKDSVNIPFFVSLIFAIHPINAVVASYVFNRSDILCTLFFISSLLFFIKAGETNAKYLILSLLCFVLSLSAKQSAVTLPVFILIIDYIFLNNFDNKLLFKNKYYHFSYWLVLFLYLAFRYFYLGGIGDLEGSPTTSRYSYFITQPFILLKYLKLLVLPIGVSFEHGADNYYSILEPKVLISVVIILIIVILICFAYRNKNNLSKMYIFCMSWFFIHLSPTSSFFPTTAVMTENRIYLSGVGIILLLIFTLHYLKINLISIKIQKVTILAFLILFISFLCANTMKRNELMQNPYLLWKDVITKYPDHFRAHNNLALLYQDNNEYSKAIKEYNIALALNPKYTPSINNLACIYYVQQDYDKAADEYKKILKLEPNNFAALNNLGNIYSIKKEHTTAILYYEKTLTINPTLAEAYNNMAILYEEQNKHSKAKESYKKAVNVDPNNAMLHYNYGLLLHKLNLKNEAIKEFEIALILDPKQQNIKSFLNDLKNNTNP